MTDLKTLIKSSEFAEDEKILVTKLATAIGVHATTVRRWIRMGHVPSAEGARKVASALDVPLSEVIVGGEGASGGSIRVWPRFDDIPEDRWIQLIDSADQIKIYSSGSTMALLEYGSRVRTTLQYRGARDEIDIQIVMASPANECMKAITVGEGIRETAFTERAELSLTGWSSALENIPTAEIRAHSLAPGSSSYLFGSHAIITNRFLVGPDRPTLFTAELIDAHHALWGPAHAQFDYAWQHAEPVDR